MIEFPLMPVRIAVAVFSLLPTASVALVVDGPSLPSEWIEPNEDPMGLAKKLAASMLGCSVGDWLDARKSPEVGFGGGELCLTYAILAPGESDLTDGLEWFSLGRVVNEAPGLASLISLLLRSI